MRGFTVVFSILFFSVPLHPQSLEPGTPLRAHARGYTVTGELVRLGPDSLDLRSDPRSAAPGADRSIALSDILRLERSVPRSRGRGAARGAVWGGVIGAVAGAVVGAIDQSGCPDGGWNGWCFTGNPEIKGALVGGAILGGLGAGIGAGFGAAFPGRIWESVPFER